MVSLCLVVQRENHRIDLLRGCCRSNIFWRRDGIHGWLRSLERSALPERKIYLWRRRRIIPSPKFILRVRRFFHWEDLLNKGISTIPRTQFSLNQVRKHLAAPGPQKMSEVWRPETNRVVGKKRTVINEL